jgi:hypothetical protein
VDLRYIKIKGETIYWWRSDISWPVGRKDLQVLNSL